MSLTQIWAIALKYTVVKLKSSELGNEIGEYWVKSSQIGEKLVVRTLQIHNFCQMVKIS